MNRYACIHGHFYQPPRENAWLETVEVQDSAYPYHDWNERITAECYAPNTASRILGPERRIINIVNNFQSISFNVGPTLLSWLERRRPQVYRAILQGDRASRRRFSGHGAAVAQVYNHMIMPLAGERDRRTQVIWGLRDFEKRFGRPPEGMWLPETAVDLPTLALLAGQGLRFTILAPGQAARARRIGEQKWQDVSGGRVDPKMPYLCRLPGGGEIALFFYDGPVSQEVGFGGALERGEGFADRLASAFDGRDSPQLVHIATDGETYGHHRPFGDMALAYCLYHLQTAKLATITVYGEYLEKQPPTHEVEILENTSWSCFHGVERWRSNCGCSTGGHPGWQQEWRGPLRAALDALRDACAPLYEREGGALFRDPWAARDEYIEVVLDRSEPTVERFLGRAAGRELGPEEQVRALKLLELQRHAMLMYTSCGWFFDEISGIETVQVLQYADRVVQLAQELFSVELEEPLRVRLRQAPSNIPRFGNGEGVYEQLVRPTRVQLMQVGVHYAVSSLFREYPESAEVYCYEVESLGGSRVDSGRMRMAFGRARLRSRITWEQQALSFAVLHLGGHVVNGGVRELQGEEAFEAMRAAMQKAFEEAEIAEVVRLMDDHFGMHNYSLRELFRDEQRRFFEELLLPTLQELTRTFRRIYEEQAPVMQAMMDSGVPLPAALLAPLQIVLTAELQAGLEKHRPDVQELRRLAAELRRWKIELELGSLQLAASRRVGALLGRVSAAPEDSRRLALAADTLEALQSLPLRLDLWEAQNAYFQVAARLSKELARLSEQKEQPAPGWVAPFQRLGELLHVQVGR
jgi:alpha-amylase/alpha-mannosidase (GH57 family)